MGFRSGIVGLPNAGKSTLFNALTGSAAAQVASFPFSTINPNRGEVPVPDPRLMEIARIAGSAEAVPARMTFVDIAGLVRGASTGEGLGNRFLASIREMDAVIQVLRCFENGDVAHVEGRVDPLADADIVETELMLADLESLERRRAAIDKKVKGGDRESVALGALMRRATDALEAGRPARGVDVSSEERPLWNSLHLLTAKPVLYVCNVSEEDLPNGAQHVDAVSRMAESRGAFHVVISAAIEAEIGRLDAAERAEFICDLGLEEAGLNRLIRAGYQLLGLETFFTTGPKMTRAWTFVSGTPAVDAVGVVHSDFSRGFIRVEAISHRDYVDCGGEQGARDAGRVRIEGRGYRVVDGDVLNVLFNV
ncbi:MAG: redox-regulated ATPase YchF [Paracoccaceae bacterium]|nr:redox-regulated ATPase YchF [Paracoccaceae bacterium]